MPRFLPLLLLPLIVVPVASAPIPPEARKPAWPMFGGSPSRNMANLTARDIPDRFNLNADVLWKADLGSLCFASPVVANGVVLIGTNNDRPRNLNDLRPGGAGPIDRPILMCLRAKDGEFLWQARHDRPAVAGVGPWPQMPIVSTPAVDGQRIYLTMKGEVVCMDLNGFTDGNQGFQGEKFTDSIDADILWSFDMTKELGVVPHETPACSPLVAGGRVFLITGNGVNAAHNAVMNPNAPSFIALDKNTGKLLWKDNSPGTNIMHGQWSSPAYTEDPVPQVIFPGGDGWLRAFDPATGTLLWQFDANPKDAVYELGGGGTKSDFMAMPVIHNGRLFIGTGQDPEHTTGIAWFWCIDLKRAVENAARNRHRDVSRDLIDRTEKQADGSEKVFTKPNPDSALAWVYGGKNTHPWTEREYKFGRTLSTACVVDDLVYVAELTGILHCLDAKTGKQFWEFDTKASIWCSPIYADGKIYLGNDQGDLYVFRHVRNPDVIDLLDFQAADRREAKTKLNEKKQLVRDRYLLSKTEFNVPIRSTPCIAGGVLYVATEKTLFALGKK